MKIIVTGRMILTHGRGVMPDRMIDRTELITYPLLMTSDSHNLAMNVQCRYVSRVWGPSNDSLESHTDPVPMRLSMYQPAIERRPPQASVDIWS